MWRVSSLFNPARSRLLSVNTWVHSAARQRDTIAFQKTNQSAFRLSQAKTNKVPMPLILAQPPSNKPPAELTQCNNKCKYGDSDSYIVFLAVCSGTLMGNAILFCFALGYVYIY